MEAREAAEAAEAGGEAGRPVEGAPPPWVEAWHRVLASAPGDGASASAGLMDDAEFDRAMAESSEAFAARLARLLASGGRDERSGAGRGEAWGDPAAAARRAARLHVAPRHYARLLPASSLVAGAGGEPDAGTPRGRRRQPARVRSRVAAEAEPAESIAPLEPAPLRELLVWRLGYHLAEFARVILAHHFRAPFSRLHEELLARRDAAHLATYCPGRAGRRLAVAAPRGAAKSTLVSLLFPLHDLLYTQERYVVLLSATEAQAARRLAQLRAELEGNPWLARLFPGVTGRRAPGLRRANARSLATTHCRIDARGAGCELRGLADGAWRPTRVVLDDAEPDAVAWSGRVRARLHAWFAEVVEPLGDPSTHLDVVGTLLHPESLLATLLGRPDFAALRRASVLAWSPREDLWEQWRALRRGEGGEAAADAFFRAREAEMLADTEVLWPAREPYVELMRQMERLGRRAFLKEKQNEPTLAEEAAFDLARATWFDLEEEGGDAGDRGDGGAQGRVALRALSVVGFLDPATGAVRGGRGDDAALAVVGVRGRGGDAVYHLLDVWMAAAVPTRQIATAWALHERWGFVALGYEANVFQGMLAEPFEAARRERRAAGLRSDLALRPTTHHRNKEQRILALQPLLETGRLRLRRGLAPRFLAQLEQWPGGGHDDGLDAVAAAVELAASLLPPSLAGTRTRARPGRGGF